MTVKKLEGAYAVDGVAAVKEIDVGSFRIGELGVESSDFRIFQCNPFIRCDGVVMASLNHEWAWGDQGGHLGVVERAAQIELEDLVLARPDVAVGRPGGRVLSGGFSGGRRSLRV